MAGRVAFAGPYNFELSVRPRCEAGGGAGEGSVTIDGWQGREYRRVVWWPGYPALLRLKSRGVVERPELEWRLEAGVEAGVRHDCNAAVKRLLGAAVDLGACYAAFRGDPLLGGLAEQFYGARVLQFPSLYECLLSTVLEQQLSPAPSTQLKQRLVQALGPAIGFDGHTYYGYPAPAALAVVPAETLHALGISLPKARGLIAVARAAEALPRLYSAAADESTESARERLMRLPGVGSWSAEWALLLGLAHTDAVPAGDPHLQRTVRRLYGLRAPVTSAALGRRWRNLAPWRGYAAYYLWLTRWA